MKPKHLLLSGSLFYVVIAPFFFHPDLKIIYSIASLLSTGVLNVYAHYTAFPQLFSLGPFVYPPAAYFLIGLLSSLARLLAGKGFLDWLAMGNTAVQVEGIYRYLLAIKLPFIALHLVSGWLLTKLVTGKDKALVAALWFFNPMSIYIVALMGQIDGLAVIWIILALVWAKTHPKLGAISLGIGAAVKSFPLLLLPIYIILVAKTWKQRIGLGLAGLLSYGLWLVWFLQTPGFYSQALASGLSKSVLTVGVPVALVLVFLTAWVKHSGRVEKMNNYFLLVALVILAGIHFHPQWILWALPMAVIYVAQSKNWWWGILLTAGWIGNLLSFSDKFLTFGLLSTFDYSVLFLPAVVLPAIIGRVLIIICLVWLAYETIFN